MGTASASAVRAASWRGEGFFSESIAQSYGLEADGSQLIAQIYNLPLSR